MLNFEDNFPLRQITTLGIGGPAKKFVIVKTEVELLEAIQFAKQKDLSTGSTMLTTSPLETGLNHLIIGGGSNLLVSDEGVDCLVIKNEISGIRRHLPGEQKRHLEGEILSVKSGTPLQELVDYTVHHGLDGLQKLTGIPGTVGGAVYGNAGAYGQTISDNILSVVVLSERSESKDLSQTRVTLSKNQCQFNYRDSIFKKTHAIILEVTFKLKPADPATLKKEAEEVLSKRLVKYPPGLKCPGSFFKNIVVSTLPAEILDKIPSEKIVYGKLPAGALLEEVGAKGQSLNGIKIADYHANLFINKNNGSAKAFYNLSKTYAQKVKQKFGITLEPEVQLINLPPLI